MRRLLKWTAGAVLPALLVGVLGVGCGDKDKGEPSKPADTKPPKGPGKAKGLEPVASKGTATLKGKVTLAGAKPDIADLDNQIKAQIELKADDKNYCLSGDENEKNQQKWRINDDGSVANVFVWLAPPEGHYFKVDLDKPTWEKEVVIDQPHCAFVPLHRTAAQHHAHFRRLGRQCHRERGRGGRTAPFPLPVRRWRGRRFDRDRRGQRDLRRRSLPRGALPPALARLRNLRGDKERKGYTGQ